MLGFFRKYQWYFFLVITVVIVISFSFFGTYSSLMDHSVNDEVVFTAVDGSKIAKSELEEMTLFLKTDNYDKMAFGGAWGPNFLNNGVIREDFLQTGLGAILVDYHKEDIGQDLQTRLAKEKRFVFYSHPEASFVNADMVWNYFAPQIKSGIDFLRQADNASDTEAFQQRVKLFLAEKEFPSSTLRRILRYQQKQYDWLPPDASLDQRDLSLFGYHTTEDWFGPHFVKAVATFIINAAKIAEKQGYVVTKEETLADLMRQTDQSYQQTIANNPHLGVATREEFYQEQLRRMGMDQATAIRIWKQVLLFRRLFHDEGNSVFIDPLPFQQFTAYAKEGINGYLYRLPKALRLANYRDLQRLEMYLSAVTDYNIDGKSLELPTAFFAPEKVAEEYPELVQKRYLLEISEIDKNNLQVLVPIKETWNWEVVDSNWLTLQKEFPELGMKKATTRQERFAALDSLEPQTRARIDSFARKEIVNTHPEWIEKALQSAKPKKMAVGIQLQGGEIPFVGVKDRQQLISLLDRNDPSLAVYTADKNKYYAIKVLDQSAGLELLSFAQAVERGAMDSVVKRRLEAYYTQVRQEDPIPFQQIDGSWKPIEEVQNLLADRYLSSVLSALREHYLSTLSAQEKPFNELNGDFLATVRFYTHVKNIKGALEREDANATSLYTDAKDGVIEQEILTPSASIADQWKLEKTTYHEDRSGNGGGLVNKDEIFSLAEGAWSSLQMLPNGDMNFIQIREKSIQDIKEEIAQQMQQAQKALSADAQRTLMHAILTRAARASLSIKE